MENKQPLLVVFAGPNGSGKSTITVNFNKPERYTNADEIVKNADMSNVEAAKYVNQKRYEAIKKKLDFSFETVLSSDYSMDIIRKACAEGYFIKCVFVLTASPELNVFRVQARTAQGGHDVPKEKIISRYDKSLKNIRELIQLCDILHIYDNTGAEPWRIFRKHKEEPYKIFPNEFWDAEDILTLVM